jgi:hypothetical protein
VSIVKCVSYIFFFWDNGGLYAATLAEVEGEVKYKVHV